MGVLVVDFGNHLAVGALESGSDFGWFSVHGGPDYPSEVLHLLAANWA